MLLFLDKLRRIFWQKPRIAALWRRSNRHLLHQPSMVVD